MTKGEYLDSVGVMVFMNPKTLQEEADDDFKRMADRLLENFKNIWNENKDTEV